MVPPSFSPREEGGGGEEGRDTEGKDRLPPPQPLRPLQGWRTAERTHTHPPLPSHAILTDRFPGFLLYCSPEVLGRLGVIGERAGPGLALSEVVLFIYWYSFEFTRLQHF